MRVSSVVATVAGSVALVVLLNTPGGLVMAAEDRVSYLDNGVIRLGINLELGGAITWVSESGDGVNLINSHDWGRQIQMSHYSGPVPFEPNGKKPNEHWAKLGWNPIQSGDCFGHRSQVVEQRTDGQTLYVKCRPMQWPLNNEPGECTFECWIELDGATAKVRSRLNNARTDTTQYAGRGQELPAIYTNAPWWRLMTYRGPAPFTGGELEQMPAKMPWSGWSATENWAALVDDDGWGLGVWEPGVYRFIGGFAGKPGTGGPKDAPTGYIAPLHTEILDHDIVYEYQYTLILGSLSDIRGYVYQHAGKPQPPVWTFTSDRQHWTYAHATDSGWPIRDELVIHPGERDPQLLSPWIIWPAADAPTLYLDGAWQTTDRTVTVFWSTADQPGFAAARAATFEVVPDGQRRRYEVRLADSPEYRGMITGLRIDPVAQGQEGDVVRLRSVGFKRPAD